MPAGGTGSIVIHFPDVIKIYIQGVDYTDNVLSHYFLIQYNQIGEFSVKFFGIGGSDRVRVRRGSFIQLRLANNLLFKGRIEKCLYKSNEFCDVSGYGAVESLLKDRLVKITASSDSTSADNRVSYGLETISGVSSVTLVAEQISGVSTIKGCETNDYLGHVAFRGEFDNELAFLDGFVRAMSGVWWGSYGAYPYDNNYYNVGKSRRNDSVVKSFYLAGDNQNASYIENEENEEDIATSIVCLGSGDGVNQLQSRCYHATTNFTRLLSGCTADDTILTVESTNGFDSSTGKITFEDWETGIFDSDKWYTIDPGSAQGDAVVQNSVVKNGVYSLELYTASSSWTYYIQANIAPGSIYSTWLCAEDVSINYSLLWVLREITGYHSFYIFITGSKFVFYSDSTMVELATIPANNTWYRFEINHVPNSFTCSYTLYDAGDSVLETNTVDVLAAWAPTITGYGVYSASVGAKRSAYFDDLTIDRIGLLAGSEKVKYTGKDSTHFTGCTRSPMDGFVSGQKYFKKYAHSGGVAVFDASYTENSTDGNSKIDEYGLKQKIITDKRIDNQDQLDLTAANALLSQWEIKPTIELEPIDLYDCFKTLVVGDKVYVSGVDVDIDSYYKIVSEQFEQSEEGLERLVYRLENVPSSFTTELRSAAQTSKVESQYGQGSASVFNASDHAFLQTSEVMDLKVRLPSDIVTVNDAKLDLQLTSGATCSVYCGSISGALGIVSTNVVSGVSVDLKEWIVSGVSLDSGNWMLVRIDPDIYTELDAALFAKVWIEAK